MRINSLNHMKHVRSAHAGLIVTGPIRTAFTEPLQALHGVVGWEDHFTKILLQIGLTNLFFIFQTTRNLLS